MVRIAALTTLLVALMTSSVTAAPALDERAALEEMLGRVQLMPGRGHRALTVFPLVLPAGEKETAAKSVKSLREAVEDREIVLAEPLKPARRYNVLVTSRSEQAVLLPAGTILTGGRLDRMIPRDTLVAPGQQLQIGTLPAEYRRDSRDGKGAPTDFRVSRHLAPLVLRQGGVFSARLDLVPSFIARFLDYRPVGNRRHTMDAISASPVLAGMLKGDLAAHPSTNTAFLAFGALIASFVGTTGASMLLIRP